MTFFRSQFLIVFAALLFLRVVIGAYFFHEGVTKIKGGDFDCGPFFSQARGPLAPLFHNVIDDYSGHQRLCLVPVENRAVPRYEIDPTLTRAIWEDHIGTVAEQSDLTAEQKADLQAALRDAKLELESFFAMNEEEILAWANSADRLSGFERDGQQREQVVKDVESLYEQVETIRYDRTREAGPWLAKVESIWDELEVRVNEVIGAETPAKVDRPFRPQYSAQSLINRYIPWFDLIVGGLLIIGLFSRLASLAGIGLLVGVVATQPPWVQGALDTFPQWISLAGLTVVFATAAGRCGGLDFFLQRRPRELDELE